MFRVGEKAVFEYYGRVPLRVFFGPSRHLLKVQKEGSALNTHRDTIVKIFIKFTVPKNTHTSRKPHFP